MSNTIVDMPKVCQMLDAGWEVHLFKNSLDTYTAIARNGDGTAAESAIKAIDEQLRESRGLDIEDDETEFVVDDFTPEQALTRLAYTVYGEILDSQPH